MSAQARKADRTAVLAIGRWLRSQHYRSQDAAAHDRLSAREPYAKEVGYRFTRLVLVQCAIFQWRRVANSDRSDPAGMVRGGELSSASAVVRSATHSHPAVLLRSNSSAAKTVAHET